MLVISLSKLITVIENKLSFKPYRKKSLYASSALNDLLELNKLQDVLNYLDR